MGRECPYCGAQLGELDQFCTKCGLGTQAYLPMEEQQRSQKKKKTPWWMIPLLIVVIGAVMVIAMWPRLSLYFSPELGLVEALANTGADITARVEGSPLALVGQYSNWEEGCTTTIAMDLSVIGYEGFGTAMTSAWDPKAGSIMLSSSRKLFGKTSADSVYSTQDQVVFAQEASGSIEAYTVDLDSLSQGLEEEMFSGMDENSREAFTRSLDALRLHPDAFDRAALNKRYIQALMDILKESERSVGYEDHMLEGQKRNCAVISYSFNNYILAQGLDALADIAGEDMLLHGSYFSRKAMISMELFEQEETEKENIPTRLRAAASQLRQDRDGGITIAFHLYDQKLVRLCLVRQTRGNEDFRLDAELGMDVSAGEILVAVTDQDEQTNYLLRTYTDDQTHSDTLTISGQDREDSLAWYWNRESGELLINMILKGEQIEICGQLIGEENGFTLNLPDVLGLLSADGFGGMKFVQSVADLDLRVTVIRGASIQIPQGKPVEEWTGDDLKRIQKNTFS